MKSLACRRFWPGRGPVLPGVRLLLSEGRVAGLERCEGGVPGLVMPSFIDAHVHFSWKASTVASLDLSGVRSGKEMLAMVENAPVTPDPLVRGLGFDETSWSVPELPSISELDAFSRGRPVILTRICGHLSLANTRLLRMIPEGTPDVDFTTGHLTEGASLGFSRMFPVPARMLTGNMADFQEFIFSHGVTGIGTMEHLREAELIEEWGPRLRTAIGVLSNDAATLEERGPGRLVRWIKLFLDGTIGAGSAAVEENYLDGSMTAPILTDDELEGFLSIAGRCGVGVCAHAIGARAIRQMARVSNRSQGPKVRIEHAEELLPALDDQWDPSRHSFCMQPNFVSRWQMPGGMYETRLPEQRVTQMNPFATVLSRGFRLGFGSDGMPFGPLRGLSGATDHPSRDQRLTISQALGSYTLGAADACGFSDLARPVGPGRPAHLCVLSADPFQGAPWNETSVEATILDGEVVFGDPGLLGEA